MVEAKDTPSILKHLRDTELEITRLTSLTGSVLLPNADRRDVLVQTIFKDSTFEGTRIISVEADTVELEWISFTEPNATGEIRYRAKDMVITNQDASLQLVFNARFQNIFQGLTEERDEMRAELQRRELQKDTLESEQTDPGPQLTPVTAVPPRSQALPQLKQPIPQRMSLKSSFLTTSATSALYSSTSSSVIPSFLLRAFAYLSGSFGETYLEEATRLILAMVLAMQEADLVAMSEEFFKYKLQTDISEVLYEQSSLITRSDPVRLGFAYIARSLPYEVTRTESSSSVSHSSQSASPPPPPPASPPSPALPLPPPASAPQSTPSPASTPPSTPIFRLPSPPRGNTTPPITILPPPFPIPITPPFPRPILALSKAGTAIALIAQDSLNTASMAIHSIVEEDEGLSAARDMLGKRAAFGALLTAVRRKPVAIWDVSREGTSMAWEIGQERVAVYIVSGVRYRMSVVMLPSKEGFLARGIVVGVVPKGMRLGYSR